MPEPAPTSEWGDETLNMVSGTCALVGVILLVGAFLSYVSGKEPDLVRRTHMDATLVLGFMGVAALAAAIPPWRVVMKRGLADEAAKRRDDWA